MHSRPFGKTGLQVSEVGLGCNRLGESIASDQDWDDLVAFALELGINIFDTAEVYGRGRSEEVLGRVVGNNPDVLVATKYSPRRRGVEQDFRPKTVTEAVEASLSRLNRSAIDIYQIHDPTLPSLKRSEWLETYRDLKYQGKIRFIAVAVNDGERGCEEAGYLIESEAVDALQITYNLIDQAAECGILEAAEKSGVGLLVRKPLSRGVLTGKFVPGAPVPEDSRATHDKDRLSGRIEIAERYRPLGTTYPGGLTRLAHHFSLSHPACSCIIPGARSIEQLEENVAASDGQGLSSEVLSQIHALDR